MNEVLPIGDEQAVTSGSREAHRRHVDLDRTKAVAIVFVVLGHIWDPMGPDWSERLKFFIYNFHMPLFMYLSGFAFFLHFNKKGTAPISRYVAERANRLLVPFVVMAVLTVNLKYVFRSTVHLNRSAFDYFDGYLYFIVDTAKSPAVDLWYLFTLFLFSVFTYPLMQMRRGIAYVLLPVGFCLYAVFAYATPRGLITDDFYVARICWFYVFFMMGCVASMHWQVVRDVFRKWWWAAAIGFLIAQYASQFLGVMWGEWRYLVVASLSIVALHGYMQAEPKYGRGAYDILSRNTMIIYLLNTIIIAALFPIIKIWFDVWSDMSVFYLILLPLGLLIPIGVREALVRSRRAPWLVRYIS